MSVDRNIDCASGDSILSIGYGNRSFESFLNLLKENSIKFLVDLRSKPYSKYNPSFSKDRLRMLLRSNDISYVFMGDSLGGLPQDSTCYVDGRVSYKKVEERDFYESGIKRLLVAHEKKINLIIMCSEMKPWECHRSKLIGETLAKYYIDLKHIDENGNLLSQKDVMSKLKNTQPSLFKFESEGLTSRKKYISP
ncbi:MAG: DUF488 domain-containing protein [Bacteriovoracales bacterium]|nr:DUF488 domain-containing protein [Bacteriovoracales bacterium]